MMAIAICSLGHGLYLTAVPRSTQPCILSGYLIYRVPNQSNPMRGEASAMAGMLPLPCYTVWSHIMCMCVPVASRPGCLQKANRYRLADTVFSLLILLTLLS